MPFCKYAQQHQRKFVEKLATHENHIVSEIHEIEKNISWSDSSYLSTVGILNEPTEDVADDYTLPRFYIKSVPGTHRG